MLTPAFEWTITVCKLFHTFQAILMNSRR